MNTSVVSINSESKILPAAGGYPSTSLLMGKLQASVANTQEIKAMETILKEYKETMLQVEDILETVIWDKNWQQQLHQEELEEDRQRRRLEMDIDQSPSKREAAFEASLARMNKSMQEIQEQLQHISGDLSLSGLSHRVESYWSAVSELRAELHRIKHGDIHVPPHDLVLWLESIASITLRIENLDEELTSIRKLLARTSMELNRETGELYNARQELSEKDLELSEYKQHLSRDQEELCEKDQYIRRLAQRILQQGNFTCSSLFVCL